MSKIYNIDPSLQGLMICVFSEEIHYVIVFSFLLKNCHNVQGLFVPFADVGSGDPVRVLCLLHNKYTGYN